MANSFSAQLEFPLGVNFQTSTGRGTARAVIRFTGVQSNFILTNAHVVFDELWKARVFQHIALKISFGTALEVKFLNPFFGKGSEEKASRVSKIYDELPDSVEKPDVHEHPLQKMASVYDGEYRCDVCHLNGEGGVYHCEECGCDTHPQCVVNEFEKIFHNEALKNFHRRTILIVVMVGSNSYRTNERCSNVLVERTRILETTPRNIISVLQLLHSLLTGPSLMMLAFFSDDLLLKKVLTIVAVSVLFADGLCMLAGDL
eukprot:gene25356-33896_t